MSTEERDTLRDLVEQGDTEESQDKIREMLKEMTAGEAGKRSRVDDKRLKKIASLYDTHNFWDSQPVPKATDVVTSDDYNKQIDEVKTVDEISDQPLDIPAGFQWCNVNIEDDNECKDVYDLLTQNYVEDDDAMFRFDYSIKFLQWALTPPGYKKDWLFGVRGGKKNKLFGFISGIPVHINVNGKSMVMAEINFLCVHRSLRTKKLAPVLIKEVTRRVNRYNIWQAVYTAGIVIPTPIAQSTYWHRSLNPKKLIETGFSSLPHKMPMARFVKMYKTADNTSIKGLRAMTTNDVVPVQLLLNEYMKKFKLHITFSADEIAHFFLPKEWVIESYVVEDPET
jgi:glycylpeptide N-tetradecanoyltransferase